jgi:Carbohydrate family 9 binding domain-like
VKLSVFFLLACPALYAQEPCAISSPHDEFSISHVKGSPKLTLDEHSNLWKRAASQSMSKDCYRQLDYPASKTTIKAFWSDTDLYLLFRCPYAELNLFLPANHAVPRNKLWDRDVVEMFIGADWQNIGHYREFEIAPTNDWIDLAIDLDRHSFDQTWRSNWQTLARVDEAHKIWYAAARIPLRAVSDKPVEAGTKWRLNMYRIDGPGGNDTRHFMCWQQTCDHKHGNHTPESFGTLIFGK